VSKIENKYGRYLLKNSIMVLEIERKKKKVNFSPTIEQFKFKIFYNGFGN
jgi:hypothetical protein